MLKRPDPNEYFEYYGKYIQNVPETGLLDYLASQSDNFTQLIASISSDKLEYRYEANKWTTREVLTHVIDIERIFAYRLLAILRGEKNPLPSFNENEYIANAQVSKRTKENLSKEFSALRQSNIALFESVEDETWLKIGQMSGSDTSVRAIAYIIAGHLDHHSTLIQERYL